MGLLAGLYKASVLFHWNIKYISPNYREKTNEIKHFQISPLRCILSGMPRHAFRACFCDFIQLRKTSFTKSKVAVEYLKGHVGNQTRGLPKISIHVVVCPYQSAPWDCRGQGTTQKFQLHILFWCFVWVIFRREGILVFPVIAVYGSTIIRATW